MNDEKCLDLRVRLLVDLDAPGFWALSAAEITEIATGLFLRIIAQALDELSADELERLRALIKGRDADEVLGNLVAVMTARARARERARRN